MSYVTIKVKKSQSLATLNCQWIYIIYIAIRSANHERGKMCVGYTQLHHIAIHELTIKSFSSKYIFNTHDYSNHRVVDRISEVLEQTSYEWAKLIRITCYYTWICVNRDVANIHIYNWAQLHVLQHKLPYWTNAINKFQNIVKLKNDHILQF